LCDDLNFFLVEYGFEFCVEFVFLGGCEVGGKGFYVGYVWSDDFVGKLLVFVGDC